MKRKEERGLQRLSCLLVVMFLAALIAGCEAQVATPGASPTKTMAATALASSATPRPTYTASPTATNIPGFDGWSVVNLQDVDIRSENGSLVMTLTHRALWFMEQRGVLVYKLVDGNFRIMARVHTSKSSDPSRPPGGNGSVQLGGLRARNGESSQENYVFIVVGDDGNGLSVETKNTVDSLSKFDGPDWGSPDAELRLCRLGSTVSLHKRHVVTNEAWVQTASFERADLPETLQVGANIYTDAAPDLQVRYDNIKVEEITGQADCTR